jgi:hypothetical protein
MLAAQLLAGGVLLVFGRKLFWLFVAACGFAVGLSLITRLFTIRSEGLILVIAMAAGVLAALLALAFQRLAIGVVGFLAGAWLAGDLIISLGLYGDAVFWTGCVIGGVLGAVLLEILFDWGLIALSALAGSLLIVQCLRLPILPGRLLRLGLLVLGIAVQAAHMRRTGRGPRYQTP